MNLFGKLLKGFRSPATQTPWEDTAERLHALRVLDELTICPSWTAAKKPSRIGAYVRNSQPEILLPGAAARDAVLLLENSVAARSATLSELGIVDASGFADQVTGASPIKQQIGYVELLAESDGESEGGKAYTSKHECLAVLRIGKDKFQVIRWSKEVHHPASW